MNALDTHRLLLVIDRPGGGTWTLILSPTAARCVGAYARVPGIAAGDGLLRYEACPAG